MLTKQYGLIIIRVYSVHKFQTACMLQTLDTQK